MHVAARLGDCAAFLLLLEAGADPEVTNSAGKDAEDIALSQNRRGSHEKFLRRSSLTPSSSIFLSKCRSQELKLTHFKTF